MSAPAHPHFLFFHYKWLRGSHHRDRKYGYYYFYVCIVNGKLGNIYISDITSEINTDYVDGSVYVYSTNRTIRVIAKLTAKEDIPAWTHIINNLGWSGINIYFHDVNNQIGINWNGNYMQNTIVVSKNNTFNIDIEGIV